MIRDFKSDIRTAHRTGNKKDENGRKLTDWMNMKSFITNEFDGNTFYVDMALPRDYRHDSERKEWEQEKYDLIDKYQNEIDKVLQGVEKKGYNTEVFKFDR